MPDINEMSGNLTSSIQFTNPQRETVRKVLFRGNPGTSDALLYTSPNLPGARTEVSVIFVANTASGNNTFRLHTVPKGGASAKTNALFYDVVCAGNSTLIYDSLKLILEEGEMLRGLCSTATECAVTITGLVEIRRGGLS